MCSCGHRITYGEIPNPNEYLMVSDVQYEAYNGFVDAEKLYADMTHVLTCKQCRRLWIFWKGFANPPVGYMPDS
jgi:hypothetical protein